MEKFEKFVQKTNLIAGFDFYGQYAGNPRISRLLVALKYSSLAIIIIGFVQLMIYIMLTDSSDPIFLNCISFLLFTFESIVKTLAELKSIEKLKNFLDRIEKVYKVDLNCSSRADSRKFDTFYLKVASSFYHVNIIMPFLQLIPALIQWFQKPSTSSDIFQFGFYFPFDRFEYLPWTLIYTDIIWLSAVRLNVVLDQIAIYKTIMLSKCFEKLADDVKEVIDGAKGSRMAETKKKLAKCVDIHNQLIAFCEELNETYKYLFAQLGFLDVFGIAIIAHESASKEIFYLMFTPLALLKSLLVFYPGHKLTESSLKISEQIASSDYLKLDKSLQKHLILMTLMSQKRLGITAFGLVHFDLKGFTKLVNSAYTYVAFLKTIYS